MCDEINLSIEGEHQRADGTNKNLPIKYPLRSDFNNEEDYRNALKKHEDFISDWWSGKIKYICDAEWEAINKMPEERYSELKSKYGDGFECLDHLHDYETYYKKG